MRDAGVSQSDLIRAGFSTYSELVSAAGGITAQNQPVDPQDLLRDWIRVAKQLGRAPSRDQYKISGRFGANTLAKYFGSWSGVLGRAGTFAEEIGDAELL